MKNKKTLLCLLVSMGYLCYSTTIYADNSNLSTLIAKNYQTAPRTFNFATATHYAYSNTFVFNPHKLQWVAYGSNGKVVKTGKAVGGSKYCRDIGRSCKTISGSFTIKSKGGPGCKSSRYPKPRGGAPMPYCSFFAKNYAVHGSYDLPNYNASHGCIRVTPASAKWLSNNFFRIGTRVVVIPY